MLTQSLYEDMCAFEEKIQEYSKVAATIYEYMSPDGPPESDYYAKMIDEAKALLAYQQAFAAKHPEYYGYVFDRLRDVMEQMRMDEFAESGLEHDVYTLIMQSPMLSNKPEYFESNLESSITLYERSLQPPAAPPPPRPPSPYDEIGLERVSEMYHEKLRDEILPLMRKALKEGLKRYDPDVNRAILVVTDPENGLVAFLYGDGSEATGPEGEDVFYTHPAGTIFAEGRDMILWLLAEQGSPSLRNESAHWVLDALDKSMVKGRDMAIWCNIAYAESEVDPLYDGV